MTIEDTMKQNETDLGKEECNELREFMTEQEITDYINYCYGVTDHNNLIDRLTN